MKKIAGLFLLGLLLPVWVVAQDFKEIDAQIEKGAYEQALETIKRLQKTSPDNPELSFRLGTVYRRLGRLDDAIETFEESVELAPKQSAFHQTLAEAYADKLSDVGKLKQLSLARKIRASFLKAVDLDPENTDARFGLIVFYLQAPGIAGGSKDKAWEQAIAIGQTDQALGEIAKASVYRSREDWQNAEGSYRKAMELEPDNQNYPLSLGSFLVQRERFEDGMTVFRQQLEKDPEYGPAQYQLGRTAAITGDYLEEGQDALERYVAKPWQPDTPPLDWANLRLGQIYIHLDQSDAARKALTTALSINPKLTPAQEALDAL